MLVNNDLALHGTQFLVFSKNSSHTMLFQENVFVLYKPIHIKITKYEADMHIRSTGSYQSEISKSALNYVNETA